MAMDILRPDFNWESMMNWWSAHSDGTHSPTVSEEEDYDSSDDTVVVRFTLASRDVFQRVLLIGSFLTATKDEFESFESSDDEYTDDEYTDDGFLVFRKEIVRPFESSDDKYTDDERVHQKEIESSDDKYTEDHRMEIESSDDKYTEDERVHQKEIVRPLESSDDGIARLVELQKLAEYIDITKELHSANFLAPIFQKVLSHKYEAGIYNKHAAVRTKAAEVITTMVHNNPTNQQLVMEANGLQHLLDNFISDPDVTARTKALVAISSLIRNNKPGITAFRKENGGYAALGDALNSECVRFQWEALNLIQYLLHENSSDCNRVTQLGFPCIMMRLTSSDDAQVREAALMVLLVLARDEGDQLVRNDDKLKQVLQERIDGISAMPPEDLGAASVEIQLVDSLWNACYNEPSSLVEKGLLVLPGEDAPTPFFDAPTSFFDALCIAAYLT